MFALPGRQPKRSRSGSAERQVQKAKRQEDQEEQQQQHAAAAAAAAASPFLPSWGPSQLHQLRHAAAELFAAHRLTLKVLPVSAAYTPELSPYRLDLNTQQQQQQEQQVVAGLMQQQLRNLCEYLPRRVSESISFSQSEVNRPQCARNYWLPLQLLPSLKPAKPLSPSVLQTAREAAAAAAKKVQHEAAAAEQQQQHASQASGSSTASAAACSTERVAAAAASAAAAAAAAVISGRSGSSKRGSRREQRRKLKFLQEALEEESFSGVWLMLLTDKYRVKQQQQQPSAAASERVQLKRLVVCGALIEILENEERQLQAVWACPNLSSSSTRLLLDVFLRVVAAEAFAARAADTAATSSSSSKAEKDEGKHHHNGDQQQQQQHQPRRLLFASCSDLFDWPRQASFLLAAPQLQGWRLHSELVLPYDPDDSAAAAAAAATGVHAAHVDPGFGRRFAHSECPCRQTVSAAAAAAAAATAAAGEPQERVEQHHFIAMSESWLLQQIPPQQQRQQLLQQLTPQQRELLPASWVHEKGWLDILQELGAAAAAAAPAAEVYANLPLLPQLLDKPPQSLVEEEFCGLEEPQALELHSLLQRFAAA